MSLNRLFYLSVLLSMIISSSCQKAIEVNQNVSLNLGTMSKIKSIDIVSKVNRVNKGQTVQLSVLVKYLDGTSDSAVYWNSSDEKVATVTQEGKLFAINNGNVKITASAQKFPENKVSMDVIVE